jgi:hypothetical protein
LALGGLELLFCIERKREKVTVAGVSVAETIAKVRQGAINVTASEH